MVEKTYLINLIGGPSCGKSSLAGLLFYKLKVLGYSVEFVQEVAKGLVWAEDFDQLNNQYWVSTTQFKALNCLQGKVKFIITDGCLLHGIYYNAHNFLNVSNVEKTEAFIWSAYKQFENINIYLERGSDFPYESVGRNENETEAKLIDEFFLLLLKKHSINFLHHLVTHDDIKRIDEIIDYVLGTIQKK